MIQSAAAQLTVSAPLIAPTHERDVLALRVRPEAVPSGEQRRVRSPERRRLDITKDTPLEVKTDGEALIIRPVRLSKKERVRESTRRMIAAHDETLRKLEK